MNKKEFIGYIAEKGSKDSDKMTKIKAGELLDLFLDSIVDVLKSGDKIQIAGFGTFEVSERAERTGRNPQTGETIRIAASKSPKFKAGKAFKDALK